MTTRDTGQQGTAPAEPMQGHDDHPVALTTKARLDTLKRDVDLLRRDLAATRDRCIGLEGELGRLPLGQRLLGEAERPPPGREATPSDWHPPPCAGRRHGWPRRNVAHSAPD